MRISIPLLGLAVLTSPAMATQDARSILETAKQKQIERTAEVDNYTVTIAVRDAQGMQTPIFYQKMDSGMFRVVNAFEYGQWAQDAAGYEVDEKSMMENMAIGLDMMGPAMAKGGGDQPPLPLTGMLQDMATFARASAAATDSIGDGRAEAREDAAAMREFMEQARLEGTEEVLASGDGAANPVMREAFHLVADNLDRELGREGDAEFRMDKMSLWLDREHYVPLKMRMEGTVKSKGQTVPLVIERLSLDYREVGPLYESYQQVMRISGLMAGMSEKEKKDLTKALAEMEKAKAELAKLPESQRQMVMQRFGPQMERLEQMAAGGDMVSTIDVVSIAVNEGPPTPYGGGDLTVGGPVAAEYPAALTIAGESDGATAELAISARKPEFSEARIGLTGAGLFPDAGGTVQISGARGFVMLEGGPEVMVTGASGVITVTERTPTRIKGTFEGKLSGTHNNGGVDVAVEIPLSGSFDTAAPKGPYQAPVGGPFQSGMFPGP